MYNKILSASLAALVLPSLWRSAGSATAAEAVAGSGHLRGGVGQSGKPRRAFRDGKYVSFIAPKDGVLNVCRAAQRPSAAKPVTSDYQARHSPALLGLTTNTCCTSRMRVATRTGICMPPT